ncbi:hypothetical protein B835_12 [Enterococcus mundtii 3F]|nr:hypothetical protein [Enterococcus mundtii 3F]
MEITVYPFFILRQSFSFSLSILPYLSTKKPFIAIFFFKNKQ